MIKLVISGHGEFSTGLLDAFHMIFGQDNAVVAVPFLKGEGLPQVQEKFSLECSALQPEEEILFLVDLFGGTPYNAASQVIYNKKNADIVTGVNLPVLLEATAVKNTLKLPELVKQLKQVGGESIKIFTEEINTRNKNNTESDLL